jgi:hypothetical protein
MQKGTRREKIPSKHCVPEPPSPASQELLIPTKAELVTLTVTIGIAAKSLHKKKSRKRKTSPFPPPPQNNTKKQTKG